ncbi:MAG: T9SS type A sorting domain-containing protein [Chitinophagales bacterium]
MKTLMFIFLTIIYSSVSFSQSCLSVNAGADQSITPGDVAYLDGSACPEAMKVTWVTNGTGTFSNRHNTDPVYYPSAADLASGEVTLTLRSKKFKEVRDEMRLYFVTCPVISFPNKYDTICGETTGIYTLIGNVSGSYDSVKWETSGFGYVIDMYNDTSDYEISVSDVGSGYVDFKFTVFGPGSCVSSDTIFLRIADPARIDLPDDPIQICSATAIGLSAEYSGTTETIYWSAGSGTYSENPATYSIYYPTESELLGGYLFVNATTNDPPGVCTSSSDGMTIELGPYAIMMDDTILCVPVPSEGSLFIHAEVGSASSHYWSTSGTGYFDDEYSNITNYNYSETDVAMGSVTLYLSVENSAYSCPAFVGTVTIIFQEQPYLEFPATNVYGCYSAPDVYVDVYLYGIASGSGWTTTGTGTFYDSGAFSTVYSPGVEDLEAGYVDLLYSSEDPEGPCSSVSGYITAYWSDCKLGEDVPDLILYPNPAKDKLYLQAENNMSIRNLVILDITGNIVSYTTYNKDDGSIDISSLAPGMYVLQYTTHEQKPVKKKFIKE